MKSFNLANNFNSFYLPTVAFSYSVSKALHISVAYSKAALLFLILEEAESIIPYSSATQAYISAT